jgi:hypothetical protein
VLTFDGAALLDRFAAEAFVSPINSGNARRKAARRGFTVRVFKPDGCSGPSSRLANGKTNSRPQAMPGDVRSSGCRT